MCNQEATSVKILGAFVPYSGRKTIRLKCCHVLGPLPQTVDGNRFIVVFSDYLTRYPEAFAVADTKATTIAKLFVEEIVSRHGVPVKLLSDRGKNFLSSLVIEICVILGCHKVNTSSYHPQTDGLVERWNKTVCTILSMYVNDRQNDWDKFLPFALLAYRTSIQESAKESPFFLLYGRDARLLINAILSTNPTAQRYSDQDDYKADILRHLTRAWELAKANITNAQKRQKRNYDTKLYDPSFRVGDRVLLYCPAVKRGTTAKLSHQWHGPYRITARNSTNATIQSCDVVDAKPLKVHINRLKRFLQTYVPYSMRNNEEEPNNQETADTNHHYNLRPRRKMQPVNP